MALAVAAGREEVGPEFNLKGVVQFTPVPCGDKFSPSQRAQFARLQENFPTCFHIDLMEHHIEAPSAVFECSCPSGYLNTKNMAQDKLKAILDKGIIAIGAAPWSWCLWLMGRSVFVWTFWKISILFNTGSNQGVLTNSLDSNILRKITFSTLFGLDQFVTLPFGLFGVDCGQRGGGLN